MPVVSQQLMESKRSTFAALQADRLSWWQHWRKIADMFLPRRYVHLQSKEERVANTINTRILDATGTIAARTLASGMMNGITSPSRQWFKLRAPVFGDTEPKPVRIWLDETERRLQLIMAESNFYNGMATQYLDLSVFGTSAMLIYEDAESVIRCYNPALGEYYLAQSDRLQVNTFAREFTYKVHQVVQRWGVDNVSSQVKLAWEAGGGRTQEDVEIIHLIEPNTPADKLVSKRFTFREMYWEKGSNELKMLAATGLEELNGIFPRWELTANEPYGSSPAMDAYGDVVQLQHETKAKGQALELMVRPPMLADIQLQHQPTSLSPRSVTFVSGLNGGSVGMKPAYEVRPPIQEMSQDLAQIQGRIREIFHNDLFRMIAQLDTVRSATEIDARREEKLVLLGPVLERFENEALDPAINRIFSIALRKGLLSDPPPEMEGQEIDIQYVSVLSNAQRAVGTASTERFLGVIGSVAALYPNALHVPDFEQLLHSYGRDIGVSAAGLRTPEEVAALVAQAQQQEAAAQAASTANELASGAETLSKTDVGGGLNALEVIAGGG